MIRNILYSTITVIAIAGCSKQETKLYDYPIQPVDIKNVELTDNFWLPAIKTIQQVTVQYAFDKCKREGRMDNFLIAGGKMKGETRGKMPFDDTDLYKIIEGASYSLISAPDKNLEAYLDSVIDIIATGQEKDGYLTTWKTINPDKSPAEWAKPGGRWENLATSHELYNCGHLYEAASAHYLATGKTNFLNIALKNADLLINTFGPGKKQNVPGHQIVETGLIKLYRITHNAKYLELAKFFLDQRGNPRGHELFGAYNQDHIPVTRQEEVTGHAVRAVYMYAGMTDIAAIYRDSSYLNAVNKLWENMVYKKLYITGGIGARHEGESFGDNYELPNQTAYSETCAAIGSVLWNNRLFQLTGNAKYFDVIERTLYNGLISGISLDGKKFFYPNPLESDGLYTFNQGACTREPWFDCSCCPTNLIRFMPSVPGLIYATNADTLFINLFISSNAAIKINNQQVHIEQETGYPWTGDIAVKVRPERAGLFTLKIRIPGWAQNRPVPGDLYEYLRNYPDDLTLKVNDKDEPQIIKGGYIEITRKWLEDDRIELNFPMKIRYVTTNDKVITNKGLVALEYGPIVYCAEETDNSDNFAELFIPDSVALHIEKRNDLLNGVNIITGNISDVVSGGFPKGLFKTNRVFLIPYYAWSNRGVGKMKVWLPREKI